ncbi:2-dehydropantoate 2-reductase [Acidipropionibacterium virtanenii]|uniref:2-dehydropantoate 2-reductase n=1 Tax=Acidipropionibacterium virtanenii TaxID=2057246 RepID=A0A344UUB9_9ACTN|nr:2-dehydropantoate 2-reductase [Acidipropionibacterium virtanenii]AXE38867.1 Putative 2-dehydropantoate 2-reductase [Acidipropionibacterium virtanenii]
MQQEASRGPVAVIGAGAIGLSIASALARAGHPITVCGGRPFDQMVVTDRGATSSWPVRHTVNPDDVAGYDTVVLAVKAHQTDAVGDWLRAVDGPGVDVLVAQNGVEQRERVAPYLAGAHVVPTVVYLNAERSEPGRVTVRRVVHGDLAVPDDPGSRILAARIEAGGMHVELDADFTTTLWNKLLMNITANPLTALTRRRTAVLRDEGVGQVALQIMIEAVAVARAEGARLTDEDALADLKALRKVPDGAPTSMLQDCWAGRPLEYDALTGAVLRAAERHGIDAPINRLIYSLVAAVRPDHEGPVSQDSAPPRT